MKQQFTVSPGLLTASAYLPVRTSEPATVRRRTMRPPTPPETTSRMSMAWKRSRCLLTGQLTESVEPWVPAATRASERPMSLRTRRSSHQSPCPALRCDLCIRGRQAGSARRRRTGGRGLGKLFDRGQRQGSDTFVFPQGVPSYGRVSASVALGIPAHELAAATAGANWSLTICSSVHCSVIGVPARCWDMSFGGYDDPGYDPLLLQPEDVRLKCILPGHGDDGQHHP